VRRGRTHAAGPAIDWEQIADGRVWRLRRGTHYEGSDRAVLTAARAAASRMGKVVTMAREDFGATAGYVWVQFADAEVPFGDPCPRCGSTTLLREHAGYATCPRCAARLVLLIDDEDPGVVLDGSGTDAPGAQSQAPGGARGNARPAAGTARQAATPRVTQQFPQAHFLPETKSIERLEFYAEIRLRVGSSPTAQSAFNGFGQARGVKPTFLYVRFFPAEDGDGLGDHHVTAIAARPYAAALDFGALSDWAYFELRPLTAPGDDRLTPIHPYYSLDEETGIYVIPVAGDTQSRTPPSLAPRDGPP